jgi:hypothetical protein
MRRTMTRVCAVAMLVVAIASLTAAPALAHEDRTIGRWHVAVGWAVEPALAGYPNAVQLFLNDANDKGVPDLGDTLKVDVTSGGQTKSLTFGPAFEEGEFGTVGDYRADLIPTRPGTYVFRLNGTIKGDKINSTFTCSDKTFDCVEEPQELEFPVPDPGNAALNDRITRESARLAASANAAADDASNAKIIGYVGMGLGAVALLYALLLGRKPKSTS